MKNWISIFHHDHCIQPEKGIIQSSEWNVVYEVQKTYFEVQIWTFINLANFLSVSSSPSPVKWVHRTPVKKRLSKYYLGLIIDAK